ncbi:MAG: cyclic nucleotide-binding and patatin-like phospholipase domain-containing protein, partial [Dehalococcoidia bacterium]|nr:cyclic nucleotide-binding and patatin-like phospholipase domain-containing protein [Dehalococcoidia bacterium]
MIDIDTPLLASLPGPALERVQRAATQESFAPGEVMVSEGEMPEKLFILLAGEARVVGKDWHGEELTLARLGPGEFFGELSMLSGEPASATVEAATTVEAWVFSHRDFVAIANDHPELARNLLALLAERLRLANERQLRAQRGRLVSLYAAGDAPWTFWLGHHLASSVAKHARESVSLLDLCGRALDVLPEQEVRTLQERTVDRRGHDGAALLKGDGRSVQVFAWNRAEPLPSERQLLRLLEHLQEQARFVITVVPRAAPLAQAVLGRADLSFVLTHESEIGGSASALDAAPLPKEGQATLIVVSEQERASTTGDVRKVQASLSPWWRVRSIIPGGARGLEREIAGGSVTGFAIDRLARSVAGLSVGLALGGGGAKGYAHIGVVKTLQRARVPFDCVSGCSIGAPLAAGVAAGWSLEQIRGNLDAISSKAVRPNVPVVSILTSRSVRAELRNLIPTERFEELPTPLGIVAVDIETGEEVLLRSGLIWPAMVASMAYPGIYEPAHIGSRYLVDGGVLNPVPVSAAVTLGADVVISSNLSAGHQGIDGPVAPEEPKRRRLVIENITRSLEIM